MLLKAHLIVALGIVAGVSVGALTPNASGLRLAYMAMVLIAFMEIEAAISLQWQMGMLRWRDFWPIGVAGAILCASAVAVAKLPVVVLILAIASAFFADGGAYVCGAALGHKLFDESPFPELSPRKTYEGCFGGFFAAVGAVLIGAIVFGLIPVPNPKDGVEEWARAVTTVGLMGGGLIAILGDLMGSAVKRRLRIKDSCDILGAAYGFRHIEMLFGGSKGCGGYLDRLDSSSAVIAFAGLVYFLTKNLGV